MGVVNQRLVHGFAPDFQVFLLEPQIETAIQNLNNDLQDLRQKTAIQNFISILVYFITCLNLYFKALNDAHREFADACGAHNFEKAAAILNIKGIKIDAPRIQAIAPGAQAPMGMTLLHDAIGRGDYPLVEFLLDHGASFDTQDDLGSLPFECAFNRENFEETTKMVEYLLSKRMPLNSRNAKGQTLLHCAYGIGYLELAETLLQKGAKMEDGQNLLHFLSALGGREELILKLVREKNLDPNAKDEKGFSLLEKVYEKNNFEFALALIDAGAEVDMPFKGHGDQTLLHRMAGINLEMQKALLERGADPRYKEALGRTVLHIAASHGLTPFALPLLEKAPELIWDKDLVGRTPLHCAVNAPLASPMIDFLIENGAEVDAADGEGYTALHSAALMGKADIVEILLRRGAQKLPNNRGELPDVKRVERTMEIRRVVKQGVDYLRGLFVEEEAPKSPASLGSQESSAVS